MRKIIQIFLVLTIIAGFAGCTNLETDMGSLAGAVFYSDGETRVAGAWVRVYESVEPPIIVAEIPVDSEARFFVTLHEGQYYLGGSTSRDGVYSIMDDRISIWRTSTTRLFIAIADEVPSG